MNRVLATTLSLAAAAGLCAARGPLGGGRPGSGLDMTRPRTVAGPVAAMSIGYGMEHPSIAVNGVRIRVAPVWHLLDQGFELRTGDPVSVTAVPSSVAGIPDLYAVQIANTATGLRIVLRDAAGVPVWAGGGGSHGASRTPPRRPPAAGVTVSPASGPAASEPAPHELAAREPAVHVPAASEPAAFEPAPLQPAAHGLAAIQPAPHESAGREPAVHVPASLEPDAHESAPLQPAAHGLAAIQQAPLHPDAHDPAPHESAARESAVHDPAASESAAFESAPLQPAAHGVAALQPAPLEPAAPDPAPLDPDAHSPQNATSGTLVLRRADRSLAW